MLTEMFDALLASAPDARFSDRASVAFMLAALLGGSVRMVMEADPSDGNLERLRVCRALAMPISSQPASRVHAVLGTLFRPNVRFGAED
ncbi:hypothetical protein [Brevundimonas sp.]|uniref:hypothetical protein n=1 Tax=Brevundimonas sp. TaxID=1871086 RepID=UPI003569FE59